jgi:hypothetical protein
MDDVEVEAMIATDFYWHNMFRDILPKGEEGIVLVVENSCDEDGFTYQINGPLPTYLGVGDHHDQKYDAVSIHSAMFDLASYRVGISDYTGLPFDRDTCMFHFRVYASDHMSDSKFLVLYNDRKKEFWNSSHKCKLIPFSSPEYHTNNGIVFALSAFAFILFPFLLFLVYDRLMSRQQKQIVTSAEKSNAILSDLFPSHIRDKLYRPIIMNGEDQHATSHASIIADLYPETTILIADMVNFTSWSSGR